MVMRRSWWGVWGLVSFPLLLAGCGGQEPDFRAPQSVCYDPLNDWYVVSNLGGDAGKRQGEGFLLLVYAEGGRRTEWISSEQTGVALNAPKGMAIAGNVLWVADVDVLRKFDRTSGAPMGQVVVPGAAALCDVAAGPDGSIYCSDSGLAADGQPTKTDAIWRVSPEGAVTALAVGDGLDHPTAISAQRAGLYVVGSGSGSFYQVDYRGTRTDLGKAPQAGLTGLARVEASAVSAQGSAEPKKSPAKWFATSQVGNTIYQFAMTGGAAALPVRLQEPGDFCFDAKRNCLVIPLSGEDRLQIVSL